ncbi:hypothetical protein [Alkalimonas amylolytica]|uniref:Uncharacterized protein n=1 Tax=Alkalimonas amylolytica TaxID=152573 RepID=A0A1H3ZMM9_ALKAM|nr:hypothetical protein [Alkalimonas amylolytica]SEA24908.1 hypothetical protein SAMN04488051_102259 [Alkalimonas amylolytica]
MRVTGDLKKRYEEIRALDRSNIDECQAIADFFDLYPQKIFRGELYKRESPDFEVSRVKNTIGIEVVKATSPQSKQLTSELGKKGGPGYSMNWLKDINHTGKRLGKYIKEKQGDTAIWDSREFHDFWVNIVGTAITKKSELFTKHHFEKAYFESWLLVVDDSGLEFLNTSELLTLLNEKSGKINCSFNKVFVLSGYRERLHLLGSRCGKFCHIASRSKY